MNTDKNEKIKQLNEELNRKHSMRDSLLGPNHFATINFCYGAEDNFQFAIKKHNKYLKHIEKAEQELQELRDLIIKQNEFKKVSPAEYEDIFEQTKIQMNIRKNDLKKKIKNLKNKDESYIKDAEQVFDYATRLKNKIEELDLSIEETEKEIKELESQLEKMGTEENEGVNV